MVKSLPVSLEVLWWTPPNSKNIPGKAVQHNPIPWYEQETSILCNRDLKIPVHYYDLILVQFWLENLQRIFYLQKGVNKAQSTQNLHSSFVTFYLFVQDNKQHQTLWISHLKVCESGSDDLPCGQLDGDRPTRLLGVSPSWHNSLLPSIGDMLSPGTLFSARDMRSPGTLLSAGQLSSYALLSG